MKPDLSHVINDHIWSWRPVASSSIQNFNLQSNSGFHVYVLCNFDDLMAHDGAATWTINLIFVAAILKSNHSQAEMYLSLSSLINELIN